MKKRVTLALGLVRLAAHVLLGVAIILALFPVVADLRRDRVIRWWGRRLLAICGIRVRVAGPQGVSVVDPTRGATSVAHVIDDAMRIDGSGAMLVCNHVSWADIFVVYTLRPARFIAKAEIAAWPVLGLLTRSARTIFIERGRRHAVRDTNQRMVDALRSGDLIAMFPEGTTGYGDRLLPFHANLLQPAIDAGVPIVVGGLRYVDRRGRPTIAPHYVGETTLMQSCLRILEEGPLVCELHLIDAFDAAGAKRHDIARRARVLMAQRLGFDDEAGEAKASLAEFSPGGGSGVGARVSGAAARPGTAPETEPDPQDELL